MGGICLGFLCALALLAFFGRLRAARSPEGWLGNACWTLIALTALDGLNAFLYDGSLPHLYQPSTLVRLLSGLAAGLGLGLLAPVVASVIWQRPDDDAAVEDPLEFGAGLGLAALLGAAHPGRPGSAPVARRAGHGVRRAAGVRSGESVRAGVGERSQPSSRRPARPERAAGRALGLGLLELAGLSTLRTWLATAFGFTWGL